MSSKDWIEVTASLLGGASIGAALMYLFDPERGDHRRNELHEVAHRAWEAGAATAAAAGDTVGEHWEDASKHAQGWGNRLSSAARRAGSRLMHRASQAQAAMNDCIDETTGHAQAMGRNASKTARGYADQASKYAQRAGSYVPSYHEESHLGTGVSVTAGVIGALARG